MSRMHESIRKLPSLGAAACLSAILLSLSGCVEERIAGSTATGNTGKGTIAGRVLGADGKGVANAKVRVVGVDNNPGPGGPGTNEIADVAVTAADGTFRTDSLSDGRYNLLSDKDGKLSFQDSVGVKADSATHAAGDTLKPPGSVSGVVRLQPGHDSRTVFLILLGTTTLAVPMDSVGNFRLANLAEGRYRLRLLSTLDAYKPLDTAISVRSGMLDVLADTLRLAYQATVTGEIPIIDAIAIAYDTTAMAATLTWKKQDPSKVGAYNVYRKAKDSSFIRLNKFPVADTVYHDDWKAGLVPGTLYEYALTALDPHGNEGRKGEAALLTAATRSLVEIVVDGSDCGPGKCNYAIDPKGIIWIEEGGAVVRHNPGDVTTKWFDPLSPSSFTRQIAVDSNQGIYLMYQNPLRVAKYDTAGNQLWVIPLPFERDVAFSLFAGRDTEYVWANEEKVMTYIGRDGKILGQDTLMKSYVPPSGLSSPYYKPGIGFFTNTFDAIRFHDRDGHDTAIWKPEAREYLRDFTRDPAGRWYISWSSGIVDVFTKDRNRLGSVLAGGTGDLTYWNGALYMQTFPGNQVRRIIPGF